MSSTRNSYRPRNLGPRIIHCEHRGGDGGCWGHVRMTRHGYRCEGHREASGYIEEPVPLTAKEQQDALQRLSEKASREKADWEAGRWFRTIEAEKPQEQHPFFQGLTDVTLAAVFSMIGEGISIGGGTDHAKEVLRSLARPAVAEVMVRDCGWPVGYYDLKLTPQWEPMLLGLAGNHDHAYYNPFDGNTLALDVSLLSDDQLMVLYGCAAQVVEYSCLERGARQVGEHIWLSTEKELKTRGLEPEFLMDWEGL